MSRRSRPLLVLALLAVLSLLVAACGDSSKNASADAAGGDVNRLLAQTFAADKHVDSGRVALAVAVRPQGTASAQGPLSLRLSGPFQSQGKGKLPRFALGVVFQGAGQTIRAGATSTGDKGFVAFQGQQYAVSDPLFREFRGSFEQAQAQGSRQGGTTLANLGIDPRRWLANARLAGHADVAGVDTVKITGGVRVPQLLADLDRAMQRAGQLGLPGGSAPQHITPRERQEIARAVRDPRVAIYTGADDTILRRLVVDLGVRGGAQGSAAVRLDLTLSDVNRDQDIRAPAGAKPFDELMRSLGALAPLRGLGAGGGTAAGGTKADRDRLGRYSACIQRAGSDADRARRCADLLTP